MILRYILATINLNLSIMVPDLNYRRNSFRIKSHPTQIHNELTIPNSSFFISVKVNVHLEMFTV